MSKISKEGYEQIAIIKNALDSMYDKLDKIVYTKVKQTKKQGPRTRERLRKAVRLQSRDLHHLRSFFNKFVGSGIDYCKCNKSLRRFWRPKIRFLDLVRQPIESSQPDLRNGGVKINL